MEDDLEGDSEVNREAADHVSDLYEVAKGLKRISFHVPEDQASSVSR